MLLRPIHVSGRDILAVTTGQKSSFFTIWSHLSRILDIGARTYHDSVFVDYSFIIDLLMPVIHGVLSRQEERYLISNL